jgi:hypothetical protein
LRNRLTCYLLFAFQHHRYFALSPLYADVLTIMRKQCPDRSRHFVCQRNDDDIVWSPLAEGYHPGIRLFRMSYR